MKKLLIPFFLLILQGKLLAQDTSKVIYHEIGVNAVGIIKQLISNNPSNTLAQSPYTLFYNAYYKDLVGVRVGFGTLVSNTETQVEGQVTPRTSKVSFMAARFGGSYNFLKQNRITFNAFADAIIQNTKSTSVNTSTFSSFVPPNGSQTFTRTTTSENTVNGIGAQVGVGVKFNVYKNLSVYAEVPITYVIENQSDRTTTKVEPFNNNPTPPSTTKVKTTNITIQTPTTLYLVLRF